MPDKMMRIAGRGSDGTAKAIKTDINGNVGVQQNNTVLYDEHLARVMNPNEEISVQLDTPSPYILISFRADLFNKADDYELKIRHYNNAGLLITVDDVYLNESNLPPRGYFHTGTPVKGTNCVISIRNVSDSDVSIESLLVLGTQTDLVNEKPRSVVFENVDDTNHLNYYSTYYGVGLPGRADDLIMPFDISYFKQKMVYVKNSTDNELRFRIAFYHTKNRVTSNQFTLRTDELILESGEEVLITPDGERMLGLPWTGMAVAVRNPQNTTGTYTIRMFGGE